jgi:hypothetical protein
MGAIEGVDVSFEVSFSLASGCEIRVPDQLGFDGSQDVVNPAGWAASSDAPLCTIGQLGQAYAAQSELTPPTKRLGAWVEMVHLKMHPGARSVSLKAICREWASWINPKNITPWATPNVRWRSTPTPPRSCGIGGNCAVL